MQPTKPGFYWALWTVAEPHTHEGHKLKLPQDWEVVEVWENYIGEKCEADELAGCEKFMVSVPGVRESQSLDCFIWGEGPLAQPKRIHS